MLDPTVFFSFGMEEWTGVFPFSKMDRLFFVIMVANEEEDKDDAAVSVGCFTLNEFIDGGNTTLLLSLVLSAFTVSADGTIWEESSRNFSALELSSRFSVLNENELPPNALDLLILLFDTDCFNYTNK